MANGYIIGIIRIEYNALYYYIFIIVVVVRIDLFESYLKVKYSSYFYNIYHSNFDSNISMSYSVSYRKRLHKSALSFHACTSLLCGIHAYKKHALISKL